MPRMARRPWPADRRAARRSPPPPSPERTTVDPHGVRRGAGGARPCPSVRRAAETWRDGQRPGSARSPNGGYDARRQALARPWPAGRTPSVRDPGACSKPGGCPRSRPTCGSGTSDNDLDMEACRIRHRPATAADVAGLDVAGPDDSLAAGPVTGGPSGLFTQAAGPCGQYYPDVLSDTALVERSGSRSRCTDAGNDQADYENVRSGG